MSLAMYSFVCLGCWSSAGPASRQCFVSAAFDLPCMQRMLWAAWTGSCRGSSCSNQEAPALLDFYVCTVWLPASFPWLPSCPAVNVLAVGFLAFCLGLKHSQSHCLFPSSPLTEFPFQLNCFALRFIQMWGSSGTVALLVEELGASCY